MMSIDLYNKCHCIDCDKIFLVVGSTPITKIFCTFCGGKNWDSVIGLTTDPTKKKDSKK